jgi:hypothetical protein
VAGAARRSGMCAPSSARWRRLLFLVVKTAGAYVPRHP